MARRRTRTNRNTGSKSVSKGNKAVDVSEQQVYTDMKPTSVATNVDDTSTETSATRQLLGGNNNASTVQMPTIQTPATPKTLTEALAQQKTQTAKPTWDFQQYVPQRVIPPSSSSQDISPIDNGAYATTYNRNALNAYNANNPAPQREKVDIPEYNNPYADYSSILKQYEPKDPTADELKRRQRNLRIAAISDGISAVANLIGTAHGSENIYDPRVGLSAALQAKYDKEDAALKAARDQYMKLKKQAADAADKKAKGDMERAKILSNSADSTYRTEMDAHSAGRRAATEAMYRDQQQANSNRAYNKDVADTQWDHDNTDRQYNFDVQKFGWQQRMDKDASARGWAEITLRKKQLNLDYYKTSVQNKPDIFSGDMGHYVRNTTPNANSINSMLAEIENAKDAHGKPLNLLKTTGNYMSIKKGLYSLGDVMNEALSQTDPEKQAAVKKIMNAYGYYLQK